MHPLETFELMSFVLEALVFILIGFSLRGVVERIDEAGGLDPAMGWAVLGVVLAVTAARFAWVFGADAMMVVLHWLGPRRETMGWRQATVLNSLERDLDVEEMTIFFPRSE